MYHDGCPCGERFHESVIPEHWDHLISRWSSLLAERDAIWKELEEAHGAVIELVDEKHAQQGRIRELEEAIEISARLLLAEKKDSAP